jgi:hypothetical protein
MSGYKVIAVFWEDHITKFNAEIPKNPDEVFDMPTLTVGILLRETEKSLLIAHDLEHTEIDSSTFTVIHKDAVISKKEFGEIDLEIRWKEA